MKGALPFVATLLLAAGASASSTQSVHREIDLDREDWVVFRFNLTQDADLRYQATWEGCRHEDDGQYSALAGVAWFRIRNERSSLAHFDPGTIAWGVGSDVAQVGIEGNWVKSPTSDPVPSCGSSHESFRASPGYSSVALAVISGAPEARFTLDASWTTGVSGFEVYSGSGLMRTKTQFDHGVAVNYYPLPTGAAAAALLRQDFSHDGDLLGWFLPGDGAQIHSCTMNGGACPGSGGPWYEFAQKGSTDVTVEIAADVAAESPYFAVGAIPLPGSDFLE